MICVRCKKHHDEHDGKGNCPDGGGSFTFTVTREGVARLECMVKNMKRLQAGEQFPHCPECLSDVDLVTCPDCGVIWCKGHLVEHQRRCVPRCEQEREPTEEERVWARERVKATSDEDRQKMANWLYWAVAMDSTIAKGYANGPRIPVPQARAVQDALCEAGFSYDGVASPDVLFKK